MERGLIREDVVKSDVYITERELAVIKLIVRGFNSKDIGDIMGIALKTVEVHRHNVLKRWGCNNTPELVARLFKEKILVWNGDALK